MPSMDRLAGWRSTRLDEGGMRNETLAASATLVGRLLIASLFLLEGWSKMRGYGLAVAYMERFSVPSSLLPLAILVELGGGLLLAIGWHARLAALALAIFSVLAAVLFHANLTDRNQVLHLEKDLAIAGGLLALFAFGPGPYALDGRERRD
jgi:putative oxidoreductase